MGAQANIAEGETVNPSTLTPSIEIEIVSRKWRQHAAQGRSEFACYLDELITMYDTPNPQTIKSGGIANDKVKGNDTASLIRDQIGQELTGKPILEIPIQDNAIPTEWLNEAIARRVMVRDVSGRIIQDTIYE